MRIMIKDLDIFKYFVLKINQTLLGDHKVLNWVLFSRGSLIYGHHFNDLFDIVRTKQNLHFFMRIPIETASDLFIYLFENNIEKNEPLKCDLNIKFPIYLRYISVRYWFH